MKNVTYILKDLKSFETRQTSDEIEQPNDGRSTTDISPSPMCCDPLPALFKDSYNTTNNNEVVVTNDAAEDASFVATLDPSLEETALVAQFIALGCETLTDLTDNICVSKIGPNSHFEAPHEETLRFLRTLPREQLLDLIRKGEERLRSKLKQQTEPQTEKIKPAPLPDLSNEYPSDMDELLDYARQVVLDHDTSYDSASFRDFDDGLQQCIRNHFLDDANDDDSLISLSSTRSGYEGDAPSSNQRLLLQNSLLSRQAYARSVGSIATHKSKSRWVPSVELIVANDPMAPLVVLSDEENSVNGVLSAAGSMSSLERQSDWGALRPSGSACSVVSTHAVVDDALKNDNDQRDTKVCETRHEIITKEARARGRVSDEYRINPHDNSLISETSFDTRPIRKRRFRKKHLQNESMEEEPEESASLSAEPPPEHVDYSGTLQMSRDSEIQTMSTGFDAVKAFQKLNLVAPKLYRAMFQQVETVYENSGAEAAVSEDRANIKQTEIPDGVFTSSPPQNSKPGPAIPCNTPDKAYWADHSQDYGSEDSVVRGEPSKNRSTSDNSRDANPVPRSPAAATVLPGRAPRIPVAPDQAVQGYSSIPSKPSAVADDICDTTADALYGSFFTVSDDLAVTQVESSSVHAAIESGWHRSDELPSIGVNDGGLVSRAASKGTKQPNTSLLDGRIDDLLSSKVNRLRLMQENRQQTMANNKMVSDQQQTAPAALLQQSGDSYGKESARLLKGRALIRKIQRRRHAMMLARKQEQEEQQASAFKRNDEDDISRSISTSSSSTQEIKNPPISQLLENTAVDGSVEVRLQEFLLGPASKTSSSISWLSDADTETTPTNVMKEQRQTQLCTSVLARSKDLEVQKVALQESMDTAFDSDVTLITGSLSRKMKRILPPPKPPVVVSFKKKNRESDRHQTWHDVNNSFEISQQLHSEDILEALAPPSHESPIHEYRVDMHSSFVVSDIASLHEVTACDLSGDDGKVLVFDSDTDHSGSPFQAEGVGHYSAQKRPFHDPKDRDVFVNIRKKTSPDSITDFFGDSRPFFPGETSISVAMKRKQAIPFLLNQEDDFWLTGMDTTMTRDDCVHEDQGRYSRPVGRSPPGRYMI